MTSFKAGDEVVYTNVYSRGFGYGNGAEYEHLVGKRAKVVDGLSDASVQVVWLDDVPSNACKRLYPGNLKLLPSKEQVDAALAVLEAVGDVTFKLRKPAYVSPNISIAGYIASINASGEMFNVGCKNIPFSKVEEVYLAVQQAREYNKS